MKNSNAPKFHQSKIFSSNIKENIYWVLDETTDWKSDD